MYALSTLAATQHVARLIEIKYIYHGTKPCTTTDNVLRVVSIPPDVFLIPTSSAEIYTHLYWYGKHFAITSHAVREWGMFLVPALTWKDEFRLLFQRRRGTQLIKTGTREYHLSNGSSESHSGGDLPSYAWNPGSNFSYALRGVCSFELATSTTTTLRFITRISLSWAPPLLMFLWFVDSST